MPRFALLVVGLAFLAGVAVPTSGGGAHGGAACAYDPTGRKLGCLGDTTYSWCAITIYGNKRWLFAHEGNPPPDVNAQRLQPGVWRIREWPSREVIGQAVATDSKQTRWKLTNSRGRLVATTRGGPDGGRWPWNSGPAIALVLIGGWGADCLD
jgi:hypothetical protein